MNTTNRRTFLKQTATASALIAGLGVSAAEQNASKATSPRKLPWYRKTLRWGQTNITEIDPERYDIAWWRKHWKRTHTQGVVINAGGIVAYYPSQVPLHRQAQHLGGRDLFGELCRAAHDDGLVVFARMDSNRAHEEFYRAHPEWFAVDANGKPHRAGDLYITCVNGPYDKDHTSPPSCGRSPGVITRRVLPTIAGAGSDEAPSAIVETAKSGFVSGPDRTFRVRRTGMTARIGNGFAGTTIAVWKSGI